MLSGISAAMLQAQSPDPIRDFAYDLDWHPTEKILAVAGGTHVWILNEQYHMMDAFPLPAIEEQENHPPYAVEWSPNGNWVASILTGGWLRVWSYPQGSLVFDRRLGDQYDRDSIRWHPTQPLLSTFRYVINVETGSDEQPFIVDVYWGRSNNDPPLEQQSTGKVFWSTDGTRLIRLVSNAGCSPCSEYGIFDASSGGLIESLGLRSEGWVTFVWSADGRFRVANHIGVDDLLFDSSIERVVYIETGNYNWSRMPALVVVNTFEDRNIINHQVVYPEPLLAIDWISQEQHLVTALNCAGEIMSIDIRDMTIPQSVQVFEFDGDRCIRDVFPFPGYTNPYDGATPFATPSQ
jgi:WD40 repeat protein